MADIVLSSSQLWTVVTGGTGPGGGIGAADTVYLSNYQLTLNQATCTCTAIIAKSGPGGSWTNGTIVNNNATACTRLEANLTAGNTTLFTEASRSLTIAGDVTGGTSNDTYGLSLSGSVTFTITGSIIGGSYASASGAYIAGTVTLNAMCVYGCSSGSGPLYTRGGLTVAGTGCSVNISNSVFGVGCPGIAAIGTNTSIVIAGTLTGGTYSSGGSAGLVMYSTNTNCQLSVSGVTSSATDCGIYVGCATATLTCSSSTISSLGYFGVLVSSGTLNLTNSLVYGSATSSVSTITLQSAAAGTVNCGSVFGGSFNGDYATVTADAPAVIGAVASVIGGTYSNCAGFTLSCGTWTVQYIDNTAVGPAVYLRGMNVGVGQLLMFANWSGTYRWFYTNSDANYGFASPVPSVADVLTTADVAGAAGTCTLPSTSNCLTGTPVGSAVGDFGYQAQMTLPAQTANNNASQLHGTLPLASTLHTVRDELDDTALALTNATTAVDDVTATALEVDVTLTAAHGAGWWTSLSTAHVAILRRLGSLLQKVI